MIKRLSIILAAISLLASVPASAQSKCSGVECELQKLQSNCDQTHQSRAKASQCFFYDYMLLCAQKTGAKAELCQTVGDSIKTRYETKILNTKLWTADWTLPAKKQSQDKDVIMLQKIGLSQDHESTQELTIGCVGANLVILYKTHYPVTEDSQVYGMFDGKTPKPIKWLAMPHDENLIAITPGNAFNTLKEIKSQDMFGLGTRTDYGFHDYYFRAGNFEEASAALTQCLN